MFIVSFSCPELDRVQVDANSNSNFQLWSHGSDLSFYLYLLLHVYGVAALRHVIFMIGMIGWS